MSMLSSTPENQEKKEKLVVQVFGQLKLRYKANTAAVGSVKQILRCPEQSINVANCTRILQSRSDMETDPRTFRHWKSRTFSEAVVTNRSEYFSVKRIRKKLICCLSWSSREDCTDQLTYARSSRAARSNEYDRTGGHSSAVII